MIDKIHNPENETNNEEDFGKMLEESLSEAPNFKIGDQIEGKITSISDSHIFIGVGAKQDAVADITEYQENGTLQLKVGDSIKGYIAKITDSEITVSTGLNSFVAGKAVIKDAFEKNIPVSGKVESAVKAGFNVKVLGTKAFCPISQMDIVFIQDQTPYIGKTFNFEIIELSENGKNVKVSRRVILQRKQDEIRKKTLENLEVGKVVKGVVSRIVKFGAFLDLGGIDALLPIREISWVRFNSIEDTLSIGQEIEVKIIKVKDDKISVSAKALVEHPFDVAVKSLEVGQTINCRVVKNESFGSFAEISLGIEGLIPISEMSRGRKIANPSEILKVDDYVEVQIIAINAEKRKITLSLKALQPDPWDSISELFTEGEVYIGIIEDVVSFGAFVRVADGITGLLPASKIKLSGLNLTKKNNSEEIEVRIFKIDKENKKLSLDPKEMPEVAEHKERQPRKFSDRRNDNNDWRKYSSKHNEVPEDNPFRNL